MATLTLKGKLVDLTNIKKEVLNYEYDNLQLLMQGKEADLYSANKQQALRFYKKKKMKEYPISIRNDLLKIERNSNKISKYWVKLPVRKKRGGIWCAFKTYKEIPKEVKICESKLKKKNGAYFLHITFKKEIKKVKSYSNLLAIDLGEKNIATICGSWTKKPKFLGKNVRGIRRHYAWLRKRLGNKKKLKIIKKVGHTEQRKINNILHKISREIINQAKKHNACIVLGDLEGIRKSAKGKRMNRIVANMPYLKLTQMIEYKAEWEGITVIKMNEAYTSKICSKCGELGKRKSQGLFVCNNCNTQRNADFNGAKNILKRSSEYIFEDGAVSESTLNQSILLN